MRRFMIITSALCAMTSAPAMAASDVHQRVAEHDFARLSKDGQHAFNALAQARQLLASDKNGQAQTLIDEADARLQKAGKDNRAFLKAENELSPAAGHAVPNRALQATTPLHWLPVGGAYSVTETLAPEKQAALGHANQHFQAGDSHLVNQDLQVVGADVDYVIALAPLEITSGDVHRASVFLDGGDAKDAADALDSALNSVVFVSEDTVEALAPASSTKARRAH